MSKPENISLLATNTAAFGRVVVMLFWGLALSRWRMSASLRSFFFFNGWIF
jgi:hypothetical protein